ncbi:MAG: glycosyltransferase [Candidatus Saccharibacteria bacterium]|nr:MAG: glycosyltransferase [Candidatus Saccharibacteria bacterium]
MKQPTANTIQSDALSLEKQLTSPTVTFILASATVGAIIYMIFLLQPAYRGDLLPYCMVILAELFLITHGIISFWTILSGRFNPRHFNYHHAQDRLFGASSKVAAKQLSSLPIATSRMKQLFIQEKPVSVDVFIPVYGEDIDEVRETAIAARDMYGKHMTYILDDGKSDDVKSMAENIGVRYIRRPQNTHAKAGNINYALSHTTGKFFVILDADFVADKYFLYETLPFFEDDLVAFVQTPQYYSNQTNFVSTAASFMQHVFYSLVQVGKNRFNAAFCVGTNVIFRRSAIELIGGIYFESKSEDIWTSMTLHEHGFKSVYINKVLAVGKTPETIKAYSKQQLRWATGSFEIFLQHNPLFNKKLTADQRIQYLGTTAFYFNGFAVSTLLLLPALQIYFNITPIAIDIPLYQWILLYSGFYVTQIILSIYTMGGFKAETLILSAASFPIYIKAFFNVLRGKDEAWQATNRVDSYDSPFNYIRMQTYIFIFLLLTTVVGIWKSMYTQEFSISIAWCVLNTFVFGYFILAALRESSQMRRKPATLKYITKKA